MFIYNFICFLAANPLLILISMLSGIFGFILAVVGTKKDKSDACRNCPLVELFLNLFHDLDEDTTLHDEVNGDDTKNSA